MVVGVVGVCTSLVLIGVVWWGHGYVNQEVVSISLDIDAFGRRRIEIESRRGLSRSSR